MLSRVSIRRFVLRLLMLEPLAAGAAGLAVFRPEGWALAGFLLARSTVCLAIMLLLAATTPAEEIVSVLRALRVPRLLVITLSLMARYVHVLAEEAHRMRRARAARTFSSSRRSLWKVLASVVALLFVRATHRAERVHAAIVARGGEA
jgi:cobalt/nickel transport system permease protein